MTIKERADILKFQLDLNRELLSMQVGQITPLTFVTRVSEMTLQYARDFHLDIMNAR